MSESLQQPHDLSLDDREQLAVFGHRIEIWSTARTFTGTVDERTHEIEQILLQLLDMMEYSNRETSPLEFAELEEDLDNVYTFSGSVDDLSVFCEKREQFYTELRSMYIRQLRAKDNASAPAT